MKRVLSFTDRSKANRLVGNQGKPPSNAEEVRLGVPHSVDIIIANGFHEPLPAREVQDVVVDFFDFVTRSVNVCFRRAASRVESHAWCAQA